MDNIGDMEGKAKMPFPFNIFLSLFHHELGGHQGIVEADPGEDSGFRR